MSCFLKSIRYSLLVSRSISIKGIDRPANFCFAVIEMKFPRVKNVGIKNLTRHRRKTLASYEV